ncbi:MAG: pseudouridine synthase [Pseudomonadota bacterium]|nr:pseudouridine synthase [Pseudomonadota bacterium]
MLQIEYVTVDRERSGQRIDNFLFNHYAGVPKSRIYKAIRKGEVRVNKKRIAFSYRLVLDDLIRLPKLNASTHGHFEANSSSLPMVLSSPFTVIYEDDFILVINKPDRIPVHAGSKQSHGIIERLKLTYPTSHLYLVHRLDKDVTGCLIIAKGRHVLNEIQQHWHHQNTQKHYQALVFGQYQNQRTHINIPLSKKELGKDKSSLTMITSSQCHPSESYSLLAIALDSGRNHQIRKHLAYTLFPIVGDDKYGDFERNRTFYHKTDCNKLFLHCCRLTFHHPSKGWLTVNADWPKPQCDIMTSLDFQVNEHD